MWIEIEPRYARWNSELLRGMAAVRMTHTRPPSNVEAPNVVVRLNLEIPDAAFIPLCPVIDVDVPADLVRASLPVTVTAAEPGETT